MMDRNEANAITIIKDSNLQLYLPLIIIINSTSIIAINNENRNMER